MRNFFAVIVIVLAMTSAASAAPASNADWATCAKASGDDAIAACERLIKSGARKGSELGVVYAAANSIRPR